MLEENYIDDKLYGNARRYHSNGNIHIECYYHYGKLNGPYKEYLPDGTKKEKRFYFEDILCKN